MNANKSAKFKLCCPDGVAATYVSESPGGVDSNPLMHI